MDNFKVESGNSNEDISKSSVKDNLSNLNSASNTAVQYIAGNGNARVKDTQQTVPLLDNAIAIFANNNPIVTEPISKHGKPLSINATVGAPDALKEIKFNASLQTDSRNLSETTARVPEKEAGDRSKKGGGKHLETMPLLPQTFPKQIDEFSHKPVIDVDRNICSFVSTKKGLGIKASSDISPLIHKQKESESNFPSAKSPEPPNKIDLPTVVPLSIDISAKREDHGNNQANSHTKVESSVPLSSVSNKKVEVSRVQKNDGIATEPEEVKSTISCKPLASPKGHDSMVDEEEKKISEESIKEICENPLKGQEKEFHSSIFKPKMDEENDLYTFERKETVVEEVIKQNDVMKTGTNDRLIEEWRKSEKKTKEKKDLKKSDLLSSLDDQILPKSFADQNLFGSQIATTKSVVDNILNDIVASVEDFAIGSNKCPKKNTQEKKQQKHTKFIKKDAENSKNKREMEREEIQDQKKQIEEEKNIQSKPCKQEPKHDKGSPKEMKQENKEKHIIESKIDEGNKDLTKELQYIKEEPKQTEMETKEIKQTSKSLNQELKEADLEEKETKQQTDSPLDKIKQEHKETAPTYDSLKQDSKQTKKSPRARETLRQVSKSPPIQQKGADKQIEVDPKETKQNEMQGRDDSPVKTHSGKEKQKDGKEKRQENQPPMNLNKATTDEKKLNANPKFGSAKNETKSATARLNQEKELKEKHKEIVNAVKRLIPEEGHDSGVDESTQSKLRPAKEAAKDGRKSPQKRQPRSVDPSPMKRTPQTTASVERKLPMNKVEVGKSASPNIKNVRSKIGSLDNSSYKPGGGKVKIESKKLDFSKASSRIATKNEKYSPGGGEKKIEVVKLKWNASSKVGSLEKKDHKPGGGDKKVESHKLNFRDKAEAKVGSKDNIKHKAGGGDVEIPTEKLEFKSKATSKVGSLDNVKHKAQGGDKKVFDDKDYLRQVQSSSSASPCKTPTSRTSSGRASGAISPATTGTISPGPQEE